MHRRVATAGLVAFLAIDVALVFLALRTGRDAPTAQPPVTPTTTATISTPATAGPTTAPTTGPTTAPTTGGSLPSSAAAGAAPVVRLVSALDRATAWRASAGSCVAGGARVEVTADGGATWTTVRAPARAVARVQPLTRTSAFVVGAGTDCELRQYATRDLGQTWQPPTPVNGGWARRLDAPTQVLTPRDATATPCGTATVVDLSRTSATQAEALCAGGSVVATADGGLTWAGSGTAPGAIALSNRLVGGTVTTYAVRTVGACQGAQVVQVVRGRPADVVACVPTAAVARGQVGLSVTAATGWIVAGDQTWVSSRDLTSWKRA